MYLKQTFIVMVSLCLSAISIASDFSSGPAIKEFGKNAVVESRVQLNSEQKFKVVFDIAKQGGNDKVNRSIDSLARFINMHIRAGIKAENINLALVVHGKASNDMLSNTAYFEKFANKNPNQKLIEELLKYRTQIFLCGQSATYYGINNSDLQEGVQMTLSAMTTHALLQQQGYTLNPF